MPCPLSNSFRFSVNDNFSVVSFIVGLFGPCRPFAVIFTVSFVVINSIYRIFIAWPISHIFIKSNKVISPFFANFNTPTSIIMKICMRGIFTSIYNISPSSIFYRFCHTMSHGIEFFYASATSASSSFKSALPCNYCIPAITLAKPFGRIGVFNSINCSKFSKILSSYIKKFRHIKTLNSNKRLMLPINGEIV